MPLQLFLNELSVPNEQLSRAVSVGYLKQLVATVRHAGGIDAGLILNSYVPLGSLPLGEGTTVASVRNDGNCVEESVYLKSVNNRAPLALAKAESSEHDPDPDLCEYRLVLSAPLCAGDIASGLGFAHLFSGLGVSLASHDCWLERSVELDLAKLDAAGEIVTLKVIALNADSPAAIASHADALRARLAPAIANGAELWEHRAELFPNLVFIPRTRGQLEGIRAGDPMLEQAWIKLSGIDKAIEGWKITNGPYPMFPFNVRPESSSRRSLTKFNDIANVERIFSDHCDLAPTEGRIHFIVESRPQRHALIGHVGRKLGIG